MCYRVLRPIKVGDDRREPGDLVPEAETWRKVQALVHAGFIEHTAASEDELAAALSYVSEPAVLRHYGLSVSEAEDEPEVEIPTRTGPVDTETPVVDEDLLEEEGSLLDQIVVKRPRAQLEGLSWPELRKLGSEAGLGREAKKDEIIAHLSED